jgi:CHAT domain-containing protein
MTLELGKPIERELAGGHDDATAELMTRSYRGVIKGKMRPAKALQAAQISMLKEKKFESPYFWAAFTLQGKWR